MNPHSSILLNHSQQLPRSLSYSEEKNQTNDFEKEKEPIEKEKDKEKVRRKRIDGKQLCQLLALFELTDAPSYEVRDKLAAQLNMTNREVQVWFQNRRAKLNRKKNQAEKQQQQQHLNSNYATNFPLSYLKPPSTFSNRANRKAIPAPIKVNALHVPYHSNNNSPLHTQSQSQLSNPPSNPHQGCLTAPCHYSLSPLTPTTQLTYLMNQQLSLGSPTVSKYPHSATLPPNPHHLNLNPSTYYSNPTTSTSTLHHSHNPFNSNSNYHSTIHTHPTSNSIHSYEERTISSAPNSSTLPSLRELGLIEPKLRRGVSFDHAKTMVSLPPFSSLVGKDPLPKFDLDYKQI